LPRKTVPRAACKGASERECPSSTTCFLGLHQEKTRHQGGVCKKRGDTAQENKRGKGRATPRKQTPISRPISTKQGGGPSDDRDGGIYLTGEKAKGNHRKKRRTRVHTQIRGQRLNGICETSTRNRGILVKIISYGSGGE